MVWLHCHRKQHYLQWLFSLSLSLWDRYEWLLWEDDSLLPAPACECEEGVWECEEGVWECEEEVWECEEGVWECVEGVCLEDEEDAELVLDFWLLEGVESCFNLRETFYNHCNTKEALHQPIRFLESGHMIEIRHWPLHTSLWSLPLRLVKLLIVKVRSTWRTGMFCPHIILILAETTKTGEKGRGRVE